MIHWNYIIAIKNDLEKVTRFIEFSEDNYKSYSIELSHLILSSASEIDVLAKKLLKISRREEK